MIIKTGCLLKEDFLDIIQRYYLYIKCMKIN
jgi:hypothetical protein